MGKLIYDQHERLTAWADARIGGAGVFRGDAVAIGCEVGGELVGVAVFESFTPFDCDVHLVIAQGGRWLTRGIVAAVFAYPFVQLGLRRITGRVPADNAAALALNEHLGFVREGVHPHAMGEGAVVSMGLLREHCKFLTKEPHHGR